jgi:FAD:protein FMN transferase
MGTLLRVAVSAPNRVSGIQAIEQAFSAVRRADSLLSTWRDDSEIARVNRAVAGQPVALSGSLAAVLREAVQWHQLTGGVFDPAIGPLVDAWDFRGQGKTPDPAVLAQARRVSGFGQFSFADSGRVITRRNSAVWMDTGGFGKGVALRDARQALRRAGISSGLLNFGGQVVVLGANPDGADWIVPVAHPRHRLEQAARLHLRTGSASTSSQSERHVTIGGSRFGHVLDPRTGRPVPAWGSVTVVAEDPAIADIVSTALLVLGPEKGLRWAKDRNDVAVLFLIDRTGRLERRWNAAMEQFLEAPSPAQRRA